MPLINGLVKKSFIIYKCIFIVAPDKYIWYRKDIIPQCKEENNNSLLNLLGSLQRMRNWNLEKLLLLGIRNSWRYAV